jgi:malate dehydrogenase (oxaloacetate-decarboxylating)(NADP+)
VKSMAKNPIIFAMANPDPEITPEDALKVRDDVIMATGRSDYPNQVNNVLGFPYIFRGALDVRARTINDEMKVAAAHALAELAREDVPDEVSAAYHGSRLTFGREYLIPVPFDPRLISRIPVAVAKAAMDTGVARKKIEDLEAYGAHLSARLDPVSGTLQTVYAHVRRNPKRVVFAEGEEDRMIRAANSFAAAGLGTAVLVGRESVIAETLKAQGIELNENVEITNARISENNVDYANMLYARLQREGFLLRDCLRMANQDRNVFAACMVASGHADAMVTGLTRNFAQALDNVRRAVDESPGRTAIAVSMALVRGRTVFIADTSIHEAAHVARAFGYVPRVAFLSYSTFGYPKGERSEYVRKAVKVLEGRGVDFEFDGEMAADVALSSEAMSLYPFCRLTGPANVLVMPAAHSASISTRMLQQLGGVTVIGPLLTGLSKSVQVASMSATTNDILNLAAIAAYDVATGSGAP